nr:transposase [Streptomyces brasiliensis]
MWWSSQRRGSRLPDLRRDGRLHRRLLAEGGRIAEKVLTSFPTCPSPEIRRLGRTRKQWRAAFLAYFDTSRASNGGAEAMNGLIELHSRIARGFRNRGNQRLRMLLIGGGLSGQHSSGTCDTSPGEG